LFRGCSLSPVSVLNLGFRQCLCERVKVFNLSLTFIYTWNKQSPINEWNSLGYVCYRYVNDRVDDICQNHSTNCIQCAKQHVGPNKCRGLSLWGKSPFELQCYNPCRLRNNRLMRGRTAKLLLLRKCKTLLWAQVKIQHRGPSLWLCFAQVLAHVPVLT
jgi:hypothetical protein